MGTWALFCIAPALWFLSIGLRPRTEIITPQPIYWPTFSLDAWHMLWSDWPMARYLRNSVAASVKQRLLFAGREAGKMLAVQQLLRQGAPPPGLVVVHS